ncbi:LCP family protein [Paractinoplanes rishiriensis]|uniref:LCP family protein n=1 Tax=Paractinoplanes rishiriensis TaxID=1050105 RepID=UPI001EF170C7|nr:LCP family protein [Actinoplanes rishiriensis]
MRNRRILWWIVGACVVVLLGGGGIAIAVTSGSGDGKPDASGSTPAQPGPLATSAAPPPPSPGADITGPLDLVLIGVDTRVSIPDWEPHADTVMLLHVEADLKSAYLYSLPRDLRVKMPKYAKAGFGGGTYKLTEAMSRGSRVPGSKKHSVEQGYELLTRSLSSYTGIEEFQAGAILNFGGLAKLVDQLGGVDLRIDERVESRHRKPDGSMRTLRGGDYVGPQAVYQPGERHLEGWQAIDFARQRYGLDDGDYDRTRHQRQLVEAILTKAHDQGLGQNLSQLEGIISALGDTLVYLGGRTPLEYAYALRELTADGITVVDLPGAGVGRGGGYLGEQLTAESRGFLKALVAGNPDGYLAKHPKLINK